LLAGFHLAVLGFERLHAHEFLFSLNKGHQRPQFQGVVLNRGPSEQNVVLHVQFFRQSQRNFRIGVFQFMPFVGDHYPPPKGTDKIQIGQQRFVRRDLKTRKRGKEE
jgi:hypothetical protein